MNRCRGSRVVALSLLVVSTTVLPTAAGETKLNLISLGATVDASHTYSTDVASRAIDGQLSTRWIGSNAAVPQWLRIDLKSSEVISRLDYWARQDHANGRINSYEIYVTDSASTDQADWGSTVAKGNFANVTSQQTVNLGLAVGRYVIIHALSHYGYAGAAEVDLYTPTAEFIVANALNRTNVTASTLLDILRLPAIAEPVGDLAWAITETDEAPSSGWLDEMPTSYTFDQPQGPVTLWAWVKDDVQTHSASASIVYSTAAPTARANDLLLPDAPHQVTAAMLDAGSSDPNGIYSLTVTSDSDSTPEQPLVTLAAGAHAVTLTVSNNAAVAATATAHVRIVPAIPGKGSTWAAAAGSNNGDAERAIDGNTTTWWQGSGLPTWHRIDMGDRSRVTHYHFTIRDSNHCIRDYEIYITDSSANPANQGQVHPDWGTPVATGTLPRADYQEANRYTVALQPKNGRYVVMRAVNVHNNNATLREVYLYGYETAGPVMTLSPKAIRMYTDTSRTIDFGDIQEPPDPFTAVKARLARTDPDWVFGSFVLDGDDVTEAPGDLVTYTTDTGPDKTPLTITTSTNHGNGTLWLVESDAEGYTPVAAAGQFVSIESVQRVVRVNGTTRFQIGLEGTATRKIVIVDAELGAPGEIPVTIGTHSGTAAQATADGVVAIANGAFTSEGSLLFSGADFSGLTTIEVTVGNDFVFEETGTSNILFHVFTLAEDALYVATDGSDTTGHGSADSPFRTIAKALMYTPGVPTVYVGPGLYDTAAGEVLPLTVPAGVSVIGTMGATRTAADSTLIDAGGAATAFVLSTTPSGTLGLLQDAVITNALMAVDLTGFRGTVDGLFITDVAVGPTKALGFFSNGGALDVTVRHTTISNAVNASAQHPVWFSIGSGPVRFERVAFSTITTGSHTFRRGWLTIGENGSNYQVSMTDCLFEKIVSGLDSERSVEAGLINVWGHNGSGTTFVFDRGIVRDISLNTPMVNPNRTASAVVRNSIFYNIDANTHGAVSSFYCHMRVRNSTFHNCQSAFRSHWGANSIYVYNTSVSSSGDETQLNRETDANQFYRLRLFNVNLHNVSNSRYDFDNSDAITSLDPMYTQPVAGNFRLRTVSPLLDIGNNTYVNWANPVDFDGKPRISDGTGDDVAVVDIGAFERQFGVFTDPTFTTETPVYHMFAGTTRTVPIRIAPAAGGAVEAEIIYGTNLSGAVSLSFPDGEGPTNLAITAESPMTVPTGTLAPVQIAESTTSQDVETGEFGIYIYASTAVVDVPRRSFVTAAATLQVRVALESSAVPAFEDIPIAYEVTAGGAKNGVSWVGDAFIPEGETESAGYLQVTGGNGSTAVKLTLSGGFTFAETGSADYTLEFIGHPGWLAVDAAVGDDDAGLGTLVSPLKQIQYAALNLSASEEVRVLPGLYAPSTGQTFPVTPGGVRVVGFVASGTVDRSQHIVDGENDGDVNIFRYRQTAVDEDGYLAHLTLTNSARSAVHADAARVTVENCVFTGIETAYVNQSGAGFANAINLLNNSTVTAMDCLFNGNRGRGVIGIEWGDVNTDVRFYATRCTWRANDSRLGTVYIRESTRGLFDLTECRFENNIASTGDAHDSWPGSIAYTKGGATHSQFNARRCRFIGNSGRHLLGINYSNMDFRDSLFVGNRSSDSSFYGYNWGGSIVNCTWVDNTGGLAGRDPHRTVNVQNTILVNQHPLNTGDTRRPTLSHVLLWDSTPGDGYFGSDPIEQNPQFRNMPDPFDAALLDATLRPRRSPAVNAGNNAYVTSTLDLSGGSRILHDTVDLGAYEALIPPAGTVLILK